MPYRLIDATRHPWLRTALHIVGGLATGLLVVGGIFLAVTTYQLVDAVRETQVNNTQRNVDTRNAAESAERATSRIEECTTPGRDCFRESQRRLAVTVAGINDYATYAAACADQPRQQSVEEIEACIVAEVTEDKRRERRASR